MVQNLSTSQGSWFVIPPPVTGQRTTPPGRVGFLLPGYPRLPELVHLSFQVWAKETITACTGYQYQVTMDCPPHARDVKALRRNGIFACAVTLDKPAAEAGWYHRMLTDQGLNDFFLVSNIACQTSSQDNALVARFEQQYRFIFVQVTGIARARQHRFARVLTEAEVNQAHRFR